MLIATGGSRATAAPGSTLVVPAGAGAGLGITADVGRALVRRLNGAGSATAGATPAEAAPAETAPAHLYLPLPQLPTALDKAALRRAKALGTAAQRAFQMMSYDKAVALGQKARKLYKELAKAGAIDGYVDTQHLIGASAFFAGNMESARAAMNDAYVAAAQPPDAKRFSPQVRDLYNQVASDPLPDGTVRLSSTPPGALVWFGPHLVGPAHGSAKLRPGLYLVRGFVRGRGLYQRWFRVKSGVTRDLIMMLPEGELAEPELWAKLRDEAQQDAPGPALSQLALTREARAVLLLTTGPGCSATRCTVELRRSEAGRWKRSRKATFDGDAAATARKLSQLPASLPTPNTPPVVVAPTRPSSRDCTMDSQCGLREHCDDGVCRKPTPYYRKWWFWTLVGAGIAGATVGIVVPLTRDEGPVIRVE